MVSKIFFGRAPVLYQYVRGLFSTYLKSVTRNKTRNLLKSGKITDQGRMDLWYLNFYSNKFDFVSTRFQRMEAMILIIQYLCSVNI